MEWGDNMIGTVLGDRYEIIEKIGGGGMALVYKAKCRLLNRFVAIKVLRDEFINDEEFIKKFRRESQAAASLSHPNIVNIYDVGVEKREDHNIHYIVMEYIKGKTLKDVIREKDKLTVDETINFSIQIAEALEHAHKNHIVHRDIKPHNIMITEDSRVKVTDFGIARAATSSTVTNTSNVIGSVHYFSPEQARGGYTDEKSDIYSLGIVMYEMITGKVPYEGDSPISVALKHIQEEIVPPREIDSTVPNSLQNIIMKCVQKSQADRYNTANEILRDLRRIKFSGLEDVIDNVSDIESPTQIIPMIGDKDVNSMKKQKKKKKKDKNQGEGGLKVVFLAILLAFIVVSAMGLGFFKLKDFFITPEVEVPDLRGMHETVAKEEVEKLGLNFDVTNRVHSNDFEEGDVVSQKTEPSQKVKKGYLIEVTVSKGSKLIKVPNLVNKSIGEADAILREYGLKEGIVDPQYSDTIEADVIISQSPESYSEVEEGTKINLVVSQGPEKKLVLMPKLTGQKEKDAKNALIALGLVPGEIVPQPSEEVPEGIVIWQSIDQGTELETNTAIDLSISSGPEENEESNNGNGKKDKEVPFTFNVTPEQDRSETEIKIIRIQDGVGETVYNKIHSVDQETVKIPLKGKLDAQFEIYLNGEYKQTLPHPDK